MQNEKTLKIDKNWKYYLGLALFFYSFVPYVISGMLLFFNISLGELIGVMASFIASAEIAFAISVVLLGKPFVMMFKTKIKKILFRRKVAQPEKPISKLRHYIGIALILVSLLPLFAAEFSLFLGYPKTAGGHTALLLILLSGDAVFIVSLFVLGSEFWDRLKKLFQWPGEKSTLVENANN